MLKVNSGRVSDPSQLSPADILSAQKSHGELVVQFSGPETCSPSILHSLNEACKLADDQLQVRFYGHYGTRFDAALLQHLPDVRNLAVDCLSEVEHEEEIGRLPKLTQLSFGVFEFDRPNFLETLNLSQLERLTLSENRKRNIDLSPLAQCTAMQELFINGHARGVDAVARLQSLQKLWLSAYAKTNSLHFISTIPQLKQLTLVLGGRTDLDDLASDTLELLQILRVRGLASLSNLSRLPSLAALRVEDQLQIERIDLTEAKLERLWVYNCKNLRELPGLEQQNRIREFFASKVAMDLNELRDWDWFPSTRSVQLFSGSRKWNEDTKDRLAARGLDAKNTYWP